MTTKKLELPNQTYSVEMPSEAEQRILAALNTLIGQIDLLIRVEVGQVPKAQVKKRLNEFDAARANAIAGTEDEAVAE